MQLVTGTCFPEGSLVADLFHVVKLVLAALQHQIERQIKEQEDKVGIRMAKVVDKLKLERSDFK
jgi:hypothetical protein